jgi:hypothetical protein
MTDEFLIDESEFIDFDLNINPAFIPVTKTYWQDEYGDLFTEDDLPDDGRPLWPFPGKADGDEDPLD